MIKNNNGGVGPSLMDFSQGIQSPGGASAQGAQYNRPAMKPQAQPQQPPQPNAGPAAPQPQQQPTPQPQGNPWATPVAPQQPNPQPNPQQNTMQNKPQTPQRFLQYRGPRADSNPAWTSNRDALRFGGPITGGGE